MAPLGSARAALPLVSPRNGQLDLVLVRAPVVLARDGQPVRPEDAGDGLGARRIGAPEAAVRREERPPAEFGGAEKRAGAPRAPGPRGGPRSACPPQPPYFLARDHLERIAVTTPT